jgi:hypothetical protein
VNSYTSNITKHQKQGDEVKNDTLPKATNLGIMVSQLWRYIPLQQPE